MIDRLIDTTNIRRAFAADYAQWNILLPTFLYPYGKFEHEDSGWSFIYAFDVDNNQKPCMNLLSFNRMTNDSYTRYSIEGESLEFDCDGSDELERLYGLGDFDQYRDFDYEDNKPFTMFWENESPFSQWHKWDFTAFGMGFNSAEQYMMYMKALLFEDYDTAEKVLATKDVRMQKELGRQVKGFDEKRWQYHCRRIVYMGNKYKFLQHHHLTITLLGTSGSLLVEASPFDKIWGIGLSADNPDAGDKSKWQGKNRLGYILSMLRDDITYEIENSEEWEPEEFIDKPLEDGSMNRSLRAIPPIGIVDTLQPL